MPGGYRIGLDIGGTFTDLVLADERAGGIRLHKVLTTPDDPAEGALRGLIELCDAAEIALGDVDALVHGTTLVTNAIIERAGARTALLTTRGFRDILEMGKEQRYDIYDLFLQYPDLLVPRRWRIEVDERVTRDGTVLTPLDPAQVRAAARDLASQGIEAVAVVFLHAYVNPSHERAVRDLLREEVPALSVSISSEIDPEIREYERSCTTVCNAYVQPLVDRYLRRLDTALAARGFRGRFALMQSSGGTIAPDSARRFPIRLLESGPAGGALVTAFFGEQLGRRDLVAFDMGGTTAKLCLIRDGRPEIAPSIEAARVHRFKRGSGLPVTVPAVDMMEIGAGGGSIARVDTLGLLKVGPHSAGAVPGPACYGRGGVEATVTDACLVLGYFDPGYFLGGAMPLDRRAAVAALEQLGAQLRLDPVAAAWGVHQIVAENMAAAARVYLIERGQDPRRFAMVAFGGAGPAHASRVARILGLSEVIVPPASGVASALGFLVSPTSFDLVHSLPGLLDTLDWDTVDALYGRMEAEGRAMLAAAGVSGDRVTSTRRAEMRLVGQFHDIEVAVPAGRLTRTVAPTLGAAFESEYRRLYGTFLAGRQIQVLNWRVLVTGPRPEFALAAGRVDPSASAAAALRGRRSAYFPETEGFVEAPVYDRYRLTPGCAVRGPAIVEEHEATTVVGPGDTLRVDALSNLLIQINAAAAATPPGGAR
ncbi:MAG TPA: hydantoinase/oxoprolinase family protein [bacterium]|nr:hydantoinase/oxoprolinase family protein [bacterium]